MMEKFMLKKFTRFSIALLTTLGFLNCSYAQKPQIKINGSLWDDSTGQDLPCNIYGFYKKQKQLLGHATKNNTLDFYLPKDVDSIYLESVNYNTICLPVLFSGKFEKESNVNVSIKTTRIGSKEIPNNHIYFCNPETLLDDYKVNHILQDTVHCSNNITKSLTEHKGTRWDLNSRDKPINYQVIGKGDNIEASTFENNFLAFKGLTFVDLNTYDTHVNPQAETDLSSQEINKVSPVWIVYFNQSDYSLNQAAENHLDSLVARLRQIRFQKIVIKGYTDGVGSEKLNQVLGDYRSQIVFKYLTKKGIEKIKLQMENPLPEIAQNITKGLEKYRKVEIKIIP
jgi:outer membrane protein OmpA-like peptidoglycan-associated protein